LTFQIFPLLFLKCLPVHVLQCSDHLLASCLTVFILYKLFGLDPVTTAFQLTSSDLQILNILHQNKAYAASVHTNLDSI
jgi:hypothetical protein